jgi:hypothetical protein
MLTACTPRLIPMPDPTQIELTSAPTPGDTPNMTPTPAFPTAPNLQSLIEKAKDDLAQRLSISTTQINVVDAKEVTWSNSSLGCPQPGMLYAEALTPGFLVLLSANSREYEYHAGKNLNVFYCENPTPPVEGVPSDIYHNRLAENSASLL